MSLRFTSVIRNLCSSIVAPQTCLVCGGEALQGVPLCDSCMETRFLGPARDVAIQCGSGVTGVGSESSARCLKCGRPVISSTELCTDCRNLGMLKYVDRIVPLFPYASWGQDLLVVWKIKGMRGLSAFFASCVAAYIAAMPELSGIPLVPVPPRPGKIREKGWDQIRELSGILSKRHSLPVLDCLSRTSGIQQKKLGRTARFSNIKGHITVKPEMTVPETVIILDDLMTTGSTIDACADALKYANCRKVYGLTLFYD